MSDRRGRLPQLGNDFFENVKAIKYDCLPTDDDAYVIAAAILSAGAEIVDAIDRLREAVSAS